MESLKWFHGTIASWMGDALAVYLILGAPVTIFLLVLRFIFITARKKNEHEAEDSLSILMMIGEGVFEVDTPCLWIVCFFIWPLAFFGTLSDAFETRKNRQRGR